MNPKKCKTTCRRTINSKIFQLFMSKYLTHIEGQNWLLSDKSLQPVDLGSEIIDQHFQDILNVAPGEGNSPVRLLSDQTNEAKCFHVLYPTGGATLHADREEKITLSRYLNTCILNADGRFAQNADFIFYAQYISEVNQVVSSVSVALRKGDVFSMKKVTQDMLANSDSLRQILHIIHIIKQLGFFDLHSCF